MSSLGEVRLASRQQDFRYLPEQPAGLASIHPLSHCSLQNSPYGSTAVSYLAGAFLPGGA